MVVAQPVSRRIQLSYSLFDGPVSTMSNFGWDVAYDFATGLDEPARERPSVPHG